MRQDTVEAWVGGLGEWAWGWEEWVKWGKLVPLVCSVLQPVPVSCSCVQSGCGFSARGHVCNAFFNRLVHAVVRCPCASTSTWHTLLSILAMNCNQIWRDTFVHSATCTLPAGNVTNPVSSSSA